MDRGGAARRHQRQQLALVRHGGRGARQRKNILWGIRKRGEVHGVAKGHVVDDLRLIFPTVIPVL